MGKVGLIQEDIAFQTSIVDKKNLVKKIEAVTSKKEFNSVIFNFIKSLKGPSLLLTNQFKARDETTEFGLRLKGKKTREKINNQIKEIVESVKRTEDLTEDQRQLLMQYSGNGGLTNNSLFEYYTPTFIAEGMWDLMKENGFKNGNVLEPSTGAGVFSATKLPGTLITGAEIDPTSSKVNQLLHPEDQINNQPFENLCLETPDNSFDSVTGNVPFGNSRGRYQWIDKQYDNVTKIEYYFIHRSIDKCKPGGIICLVCPTGVLNNKSKKDIQFRQQISKKAEFLGAHKLPSKTFYDQGTPVVTDILVFKKHPESLLKNVEDYEYEFLEDASVYYKDFIQGTYWKEEGQKFIHGKLSHSSFRNSEIVDSNIDDQALKKKLAVKFNSRINWELLEVSEPELKSYIEGDRKYINSREYEFISGTWQGVEKEADEIISLEPEKYGCSNLAELKSLLAGNIEGALELSFVQAYNTILAFPDILTPLQKEAISIAQESKFPEEIYKGIIMGGMIGKLQYKMAEGHDDIDAYRSIVQNTEVNFWKSIEDFKEMLGISGKYKLFKDLNRRVLKPVIDEINRVAELELTITPSKYNSKAYTRLYFNVKMVTPEQSGTWITLKSFGFSNENIKSMFNKYDKEIIEYTIKKYGKKIQKGELDNGEKIRSKSGFFLNRLSKEIADWNKNKFLT